MDYKIQQDTKRLNKINLQINKKTAKIDKLDEEIANKEKIKTSLAEIDAMGKPASFGKNIVYTPEESAKLKALAKKYPSANKRVNEATQKVKAAEAERDKAVKELAAEKKLQPTMTEHLQWFNKFITALRRAPKKLKAVIEEILKSPPEKTEQILPERKKNISRNYDMEL